MKLANPFSTPTKQPRACACICYSDSGYSAGFDSGMKYNKCGNTCVGAANAEANRIKAHNKLG